MSERPSSGSVPPNPDPNHGIEEPLNYNNQQPFHENDEERFDEDDQESMNDYNERPDDVPDIKEKLKGTKRFKEWLCRKKYSYVNTTADDEQMFSVIAAREKEISYPINLTTSVILGMKWILGNSVLRGHVWHQKAGVIPATLLFTAVEIGIIYGTVIMMQNQFTLCRRTEKARLYYNEICQASMELFPHPKIQRLGKTFGILLSVVYYISMIDIMLDFIKSTALYLKLTVEDVPYFSDVPQRKGFPPINAYLRLILLAVTAVCLIRHLNWLRPIAIFGNTILVVFYGSLIYYLFKFNPTFNGIALFKHPPPLTYFIICERSMRYQTSILPWVAFGNQMTNVNQCSSAIILGSSLGFVLQMIAWFVSYVTFLDEGAPEITSSYPYGRITHFASISMGLMTFSSVAIAYWVTFDPLFKILKPYHSRKYLLQWEYLYRGCIIAFTITITSFFPGLIGSTAIVAIDCHTFTSFILPGVIDVLVNWHRPGMGRYYYRLWLDLLIIMLGVAIAAAVHLQ